MSRLRALMVDLDGTLAHTADANWFAYAAALSEVGVTISRERFDLGVQGRNWREFLPEMFAESGVSIDPAKVAKRKAELYGSMLETIAINWALVRLIQTCREAMQMRAALVTSASRANVNALLQAHDLHKLFDVVVTGDDVSRHKPDPEAYALAAQRLNVLAEECLVYEDAEVGLASARAFGADVIQVVFSIAQGNSFEQSKYQNLDRHRRSA